MTSIQTQAASEPRSLLRTRLGVLTLLLLCGVQFLDVVDPRSPTWRSPRSSRRCTSRSRACSGSRAATCSPTAGSCCSAVGRRPARPPAGARRRDRRCSPPARSPRGSPRARATLIAARLLQGVGAAMMAPAALSILTTTFREGADRNTALGAWGAISGLAAAAGVFLGGVSVRGAGVAVGVLREPAGVRCRRSAPRRAAHRRAQARAARRLRHAGRAARHRRHAPARLRADPGARRRLGHRCARSRCWRRPR